MTPISYDIGILSESYGFSMGLMCGLLSDSCRTRRGCSHDARTGFVHRFVHRFMPRCIH